MIKNSNSVGVDFQVEDHAALTYSRAILYMPPNLHLAQQLKKVKPCPLLDLIGYNDIVLDLHLVNS